MKKIIKPYQNSKLKNGGKRLVLVLEKNAYEKLKELSKNHHMPMTKYIETYILSHSSDLNTQSLVNYQAVKKSLLVYMKNLNQVYKGLNATFNNLNQIAHHLNLQVLLQQEHKVSTILSETSLKQIEKQLISYAKETQSLKKVILNSLIGYKKIIPEN
ncbi:hypothetical protein KVL37_02290 [Helicobacter pylori]|uniref:hypothetical protein n=1 Tax=Helicobacter pylori TaxID=210 RepID=UPI000EB2C698|nr:hypothetical protein [Helicobacter pylori]RKV19829.1 hypothetical protein DD748_07965 [Helicobacter pylori]WQZ08572.1 hypothetical protein KVL37_02290 [Helicobacter pylori]